MSGLAFDLSVSEPFGNSPGIWSASMARFSALTAIASMLPALNLF
jgi:hypothetical protein